MGVGRGVGGCREDDEETEKLKSGQVMETRVKNILNFPNKIFGLAGCLKFPYNFLNSHRNLLFVNFFKN